MLTKNNFAIAALATKEAGGRWALHTLHVSPNKTLVTDGNQMTMVTTLGEPETFEPFTMSREQALQVSKTIGRTDVLPETYTGDNVLIHTDSALSSVPKPEGRFPEYARVLPKLDDGYHTLQMDAHLLKKVVDVFAKLAKGKSGFPAQITMHLNPEKKRLVLITETAEGQKVQSIIMGMLGDDIVFEEPLAVVPERVVA